MKKTYIVTATEIVTSTWTVEAESEDSAREVFMLGEGVYQSRENADFEEITDITERKV